jgi:glucokinase
MSDTVLAVDLGGTNIRMAAVSDKGAILHLTRAATPADVSPEGLTALTGRLADECRQSIPSNRRLGAICFAAPAPAAKDGNGVLTKLPNIPTLDGMDLRAALTDLLQMRVLIENDATAAGIGENWRGASVGVANSIMVTLGTGIGGGIIIDSEPLRGVDGTGGEIGHICVEPDGHPCGCGSHGCVEQYASATAIVRQARDEGLDVLSALAVYQAYTQGDAHAKIVFRKMGRYLGLMLAGLVNAINPEMIVIGGGAAGAWDAFIDAVRNEINYRAFSAPAARAQLVQAKLGDNAGILGAARTAFLTITLTGTRVIQ